MLETERNLELPGEVDEQGQRVNVASPGQYDGHLEVKCQVHSSCKVEIGKY